MKDGGNYIQKEILITRGCKAKRKNRFLITENSTTSVMDLSVIYLTF